MHELEKDMYFGATHKTIEKSKELRKHMTEAESLLWERLKGKQLLDLRFRRQHPINIFIADFYCHSVLLAVEVDGGIHEIEENKKYDISREDELLKYGIKVIRFKNQDILNNIDDVIVMIKEYIIKNYLQKSI